MNFDYDTCNMSGAFLTAYPALQYPEIERKESRPYSCLLLERKDDLFICVPFRSHIKHSCAFLFKNSVRSQQARSGLDYTKILLVKDAAYISTGTALVDKDEYNEMVRHIEQIAEDVELYISRYVSHILGTATLHPREFARQYQYSTLQYFHNFLELD